MNMDASIKGCQLLIDLFADQISKIELDEDKKSHFKSKLELTLESNGLEQCSSRLDRQLNALNLIITIHSA